MLSLLCVSCEPTFHVIPTHWWVTLSYGNANNKKTKAKKSKCCTYYATWTVNWLLDLLTISSGPPSVPSLSCVDLSGDVNGTVNVTVSWTLSDGDSVDFYLINITTNAPQTPPYGGLLNITTGSVTQYELIGFIAGYEYSITVHGSCGSQEGTESEPLTITPQGQ